MSINVSRPYRAVPVTLLLVLLCRLVDAQPVQSVESAPTSILIGDRLELFVDTFLIDTLDGVDLRMHRPVLQESANPPSRGHYATILTDGDLFRMYNRGGTSTFDGDPNAHTDYFESDDGINWRAPSLGLFKLDGNTDNNVVFDESPFISNFSPFLDTRPGVPADERFKALAGTKETGLVPFASPDGINWVKYHEEPVITRGMFDSQNVSFWSVPEQRYVCYFRTWTGEEYTGLRTISRSTSDDFIYWSDPVAMNPNANGEHLYTSGTHPYFRAPHLYIALATRFQPDRGAATDILLMTSRGGNSFDRHFMEAFIPPGLDSLHWANRANYATVGVIPTGDAEMSVYVRGRRYVLRTDGFASAHAGFERGVLVTKPLRFEGSALYLNVATSASGVVIVELLDANGNPIPGYSASEADPIIANAIEYPVTWKGSSDVGDLEDQVVRVRLSMEDADLYSLRFR